MCETAPARSSPTAVGGSGVNFAWKAFSYASWVKVRMQKNADLVSVLMSVTMCDSVLSEGLMYCSIVLPFTVNVCGVLSVFRFPIFEFAEFGVSVDDPHISL